MLALFLCTAIKALPLSVCVSIRRVACGLRRCVEPLFLLLVDILF
jgi:hypothetical protein